MSVTDTKRNKDSEEHEIEIRLGDIIRFFKDSSKSALLGGIMFLIIGGIYAFTLPNQYNVQVTILPETQSKSSALGGLGSLAGLAGIDIGNSISGSGDAIRPDLYPDVLHSVPFALQLLHQPVYSHFLGKETSLETFFEEQKKQSLLGILGNVDNQELSPNISKRQSNILEITKKEEGLIDQVQNAVSATYDRRTGIITVAATLPDPVVAADVARLSLDYLTSYITSYRTEKARNHVRFLTHQLEDAKKRYQASEYALSSYRDQNRSVYLNVVKIKEQRLQADFLLTQSVVNDIAKQLEQAKIKVSEEAPVFKVLEPARVPLKKSAPKRSIVVLGFGIGGIVLGIFFYGLRQFVINSEN